MLSALHDPIVSSFCCVTVIKNGVLLFVIMDNFVLKWNENINHVMMFVVIAQMKRFTNVMNILATTVEDVYKRQVLTREHFKKPEFV